MQPFSALLVIIAIILVYRHASGKATYNKILVFLMCLTSLALTIPTLYIGWRKNPRRERGDSWKTVI